MGIPVYTYSSTSGNGERFILTHGVFTSILPFFPPFFPPFFSPLFPPSFSLLFPFFSPSLFPFSFPLCSQVRTLVVEDKALHTAGDQVLRVVSLANAYVHREKERKEGEKKRKEEKPMRSQEGS